MIVVAGLVGALIMLATMAVVDGRIKEAIACLAIVVAAGAIIVAIGVTR